MRIIYKVRKTSRDWLWRRRRGFQRKQQSWTGTLLNYVGKCIADRRLFSVSLQLVGVSFVALISGMSSCLFAGDAANGPPNGPAALGDLQIYADRVRPFLEKHCFECHGEDVAKAGLRLDTLAGDFSTPANWRVWTKALDRLEAGEMPPKKSARPPVDEQRAVVEWMNGQLLAADRRNQTGSPFHLRRMTRLQYENTVHDLLAIDAELKTRLPEDSRTFGFDNVGDALTLSTDRQEAVLRAGRAGVSQQQIWRAGSRSGRRGGRLWASEF
jgi:hypothetical protein